LSSTSIFLYIKASLLTYFKVRNHKVLKCAKNATHFEDQIPQSTYQKMFCPSRGRVERMPEGRTV
jgi:hypothetical protein